MAIKKSRNTLMECDKLIFTFIWNAKPKIGEYHIEEEKNVVSTLLRSTTKLP